MSAMSSLLSLFPDLPAKELAAILAASPYLCEQLHKHPDWAALLMNASAYSEGQLLERMQTVLMRCEDETSLLRQVRLLRHQETCRIAWRELSGQASLFQTLHDTSDLAEALVSACLAWWHKELCKKMGTPRNQSGIEQSLIVLGMGKLGGRELNFSSDIDLIFAFPEAGQTDGRRELDNQEFFIRLGQKLINTLGQVTADGFAYRVDMRLRPFGDAGALALSFDAMEHYYQTHGREWERYAMIKARVIAGNAAEGGELMQRLQPFIYRRYLDYGAVEQLREMKQMINREAERRGKVQDVKLGAGGIREIEFITQVFQLMRGGREPSLQQCSLLLTLDALGQLNLLTRTEVETLRIAYTFLRNTENRVQMWSDEQTHALPDDPAQQTILAQSMGFTDWEAFIAELDIWRGKVQELFRRIFAVDEQQSVPVAELGLAKEVWSGQIDPNKAKQHLRVLGYQQIDDIYQQIDQLHNSRLYQALTEVASTRIDRLLPQLLVICAKQQMPDNALRRSLQVVHAIARRSVYMSLLLDNPDALAQLVKLVHESSWITTQLAQYPLLLDELLDSNQLYQPLARQELAQALAHELRRIEVEDEEQVMQRLRQFKNAQVLRVAAADISHTLPLMKVSDQLTWIAEAVLDVTWRYVWQQMVQKYGTPVYQLNGKGHEAGFAVIGYGKLGGLELGYGSDLDIIFLHDSQGEQQHTDGTKSVETPVFYARLAQRILHILSTYTHDGRLYETDTRLRPSGTSGLLVSGLDAFLSYQQQRAWIWEHQALLRARAIVGTPALLADFEAMRRDILCQPRDRVLLVREVLQMRSKMWESLGSKDATVFNLKKDRGGITDLEFLVQYLILAHANEYPELVRWSDNIRQLESLQQVGVLPPEDAEHLAEVYRTLRNHIHKLTLQEQDTVVPDGEFAAEREYVQTCWGKYLM